MGLFSWLKSDQKQEEKVTVENKNPNFSNFTVVTEFLYIKSGIVDLDKRALTTSRLQQYAMTQNIYTTTDFMKELENSQNFYQEIINIATVNETFFFREIKELNWLIEYIESSSKHLKILSMPSSSGEEVYSILLLMLKRAIPLDKVSIVGYDINSHAVNHAQEARYEEHSLHKIEESLRNKYFRKNSDNSYSLSSEINTHAKFKQQNIFELENFGEKFDVILSRNMFIYFDAQKRVKAIDIIVNMLNIEGVFIKGHADQISDIKSLKNIQYGIYKKSFSSF